MKEFIEQLAEKIANEFNLNKDAILDKSDDIFYFINDLQIIEVERKSHLSRCVYNGQQATKLVESLKVIKDYIK